MLGSAKSEDPRSIIREIIVKVVQPIYDHNSQYLNVTDRPWTDVRTTFIPRQYRAVHTASRGKK